MNQTAYQPETLPVLGSKNTCYDPFIDSINKVKRFAKLSVVHWETDGTLYSAPLTEPELDLHNLYKATRLRKTLENMGCKAGLLNMVGLNYSLDGVDSAVTFAKKEHLNTFVAAESDDPQTDAQLLKKIGLALPMTTIMSVGDSSVQLHSISDQHCREFAPSTTFRSRYAQST